MQSRLTGWLFVFLLLGSGCTKQIRKKPKKQVVQMGPMVFYTRGGKVVRTEHLTPEQLFKRAAQAYQKSKYKKAHTFYGRLVQFHKTSEYYNPALYNLGLTLEKLAQYEQAATIFRKVQITTQDEETRKDATFRLGAVLMGAKKWKQAEQVYRTLQLRKELSVRDRLEIWARLGVTLQEQDRVTSAMFLFRKVISLYRRQSKTEYLGNEFFTSMAHFRLGDVFDKRFRKRKFRLKKSEMKQDLNAKASDLLTAQAHYVRTIRMRNSVWVVRALYRIGEMYAHMYNDMMHAPTPKDLTAEEVRIYRKMLKKRIRILLTKANYAFERNVQLAQVLGMYDDGWVAKTRKRMQEIRALIVKEYYSEPAEPSTQNNTAPRKPSSRRSPKR